MADKKAFLAIQGFFYPFYGLRFLFRNPRLFSYIAFPLTINVLLYGIFIWFITSRMGGWISYFLPDGDAWYWTVLFYITGAIVAILLILIVVYTFTIVGSIFLSPFNEFLSEKVEFLYTGVGIDEPFQLKELLGDSLRSLKAELGRLGLYGGGFALLTLLNIFPPVGTVIYGFLLPPFTLFFIAWEFLDYSMERHKLSFTMKRKMSRGNALTFITFGAGAAMVLIIPLINLATIPVCVTGAALLFCDMEKVKSDGGNKGMDNHSEVEA